MAHREIRLEHQVEDQITALGISFRRFDEMMEFIGELLCEHPQAFRVIPGTRISLCKTNEFVGNSFPDIPSLAIYFHYDTVQVHILSIEVNGIDSYGAS